MSGHIERLRQFIDRQSSSVVLRLELVGICSESHLNRLLKQACDEGFLIRVSKGVYVKARKSRVSGEPVPAVAGGFSQLVRLVLARLGVEYVESDAWYEYQAGRSKQIPANSVLYVARNCSRTIEFGGMKANLIRVSQKKLNETKGEYRL